MLPSSFIKVITFYVSGNRNVHICYSSFISKWVDSSLMCYKQIIIAMPENVLYPIYSQLNSAFELPFCLSVKDDATVIKMSRYVDNITVGIILTEYI